MRVPVGGFTGDNFRKFTKNFSTSSKPKISNAESDDDEKRRTQYVYIKLCIISQFVYRFVY